jgi:hypothetical protein
MNIQYVWGEETGAPRGCAELKASPATPPTQLRPAGGDQASPDMSGFAREFFGGFPTKKFKKYCLSYIV